MDVSGVRSIISYFQTYVPVNPIIGDIWYNPYDKSMKRWDGTEWFEMKVGIYNSNKSGFMAGGDFGSGSNNMQVERYYFSADSFGVVSGHLRRESPDQAAGCNSSEAGYIMGGSDTGFVGGTTDIDALDFPWGDSTSSLVGSLGVAMEWSSGFNSSTAGYCAGGTTDETASITSSYKLTFPFSGSTTSHATLSVACLRAGGANSSTYGYTWASGYPDADSGVVAFSTVNKVQFSSDSSYTSSATVAVQTRSSGCSGFNSSTYGFMAGGIIVGGTNTWDNFQSIQFASDGSVTEEGSLSGSRRKLAAFNSSHIGYMCGGEDHSASSIDTIDTIPLASATTDATTAYSVLADTHKDATSFDDTDFVSMFF